MHEEKEAAAGLSPRSDAAGKHAAQQQQNRAVTEVRGSLRYDTAILVYVSCDQALQLAIGVTGLSVSSASPDWKPTILALSRDALLSQDSYALASLTQFSRFCDSITGHQRTQPNHTTLN